MQKCVREDLVLDNTITNRIGKIIGMDGTWFKELIINGVKTQIVCEVAYDWFTREIITWEFNDSENSEVVLKTLIKAHIYLIDNSCSNSIIQMGRSSANASTKILDYENIQQDSVISMSKAEFKHNSVIESLNGWYKEQFYKTYGNEFKIITDLKNKFKKFVNIKNTSQSMFYNKINMNEKPQLSI